MDRGPPGNSITNPWDNESSFFDNTFLGLSHEALNFYEPTERKRDLQVVPGCSNENSESQNEDEASVFHPSVGDFFNSTGRLPSWRQDVKSIISGIGIEASTDQTNQDSKLNEGNSTERKESDSDSLDVYLKPCVITPTKVEDLYSTLEDEDDVFQFPPKQEPPHQLHDLPNYEQTSCLQPLYLNELVNFGCVISDNNKSKKKEIAHHDNNFPKKEFSSESLQSSMAYYNEPHGRRIITDTNLKSKNSSYSRKEQFNISEIQSPEELSSSTRYSSSITSESLKERSCVYAPKSKGEKSSIIPENICSSIKLESKDNFENRSESFQKLSDQNTIVQPQRDRSDSFCVSSDCNKSNECFMELSLTDTPRHLSRIQKRFSSTTEVASSEEKLSQNLKTVHNDSEKQRRDQMKIRFESLRKHIPKIERLARAPKILILRRAWEYISHLQKEGTRLEVSKEAEKIKNRQLLDKLQFILK